jgi:hypothetical protein
MQPNTSLTDYSPVPDSPFPQDLNATPRIITPSMRSDSSYFSPRPNRSRRRRRQRQQRQQRQQQRQPRNWEDVVEEENEQEQRRIVKGKWSRGCKTKSCNPFRPRSPPPPPPPAATITVYGGRIMKTMKNKSKKFKNKRHAK